MTNNRKHRDEDRPRRRESDRGDYEVVVDRVKEPWHMSKSVPISLVLALAIQTVGLVAWASTFRAEFVAFRDATDVQISAFQGSIADRYRKSEAVAQLQLRDERIARNSEKFTEIQVAVKALDNSLDSKFDRLSESLREMHRITVGYAQRAERGGADAQAAYSFQLGQQETLRKLK